MRLIPFSAFLLGMACLLPAACKDPVNPCVQLLLSRDRELAARADSLIRKHSEMTPEAYRTVLEKLRTEERQLFSDVENCDFGKDLTAYNYWYRGRLKFPGRIEQEWQRLEREPVKK